MVTSINISSGTLWLGATCIHGGTHVLHRLGWGPMGCTVHCARHPPESPWPSIGCRTYPWARPRGPRGSPPPLWSHHSLQVDAPGLWTTPPHHGIDNKQWGNAFCFHMKRVSKKSKKQPGIPFHLSDRLIGTWTVLIDEGEWNQGTWSCFRIDYMRWSSTDPSPPKLADFSIDKEEKLPLPKKKSVHKYSSTSKGLENSLKRMDSSNSMLYNQCRHSRAYKRR